MDNRFRKRVPWGIGAFIVLTFSVVAIVGPASATPSKKNYTTAFAPLYAGAGTTSNYTLTLANDGTSNQTLGSANFQIPAGTTVNSATIASQSGHTGWSASVSPDGTVVQFRSSGTKDSLLPGQNVQATLNVTSPGLGTCPSTYAWTSEVKQSNDFSGTGNDFNLKGTDATLTVAKIVFSGQPPAQVVSGASFGATVAAKSTCGDSLSAATDTVSLNLATNPLSATLGGATSTALSGGSASFSGLTVNVVGTGYQLGASVTWGDATNTSTATSDSFDVLSTLCTTRNCHVPDNANAPTTIVDSTVPTGAQLGVGFNNNLPFTCNNGGAPTANVGSLVVIDPLNYPAGGVYTVSITYKKSVTGSRPASSFVVCISKNNGNDWTGPLPACATSSDTQCVVSQKRTNLGDLLIVLRFAPGDPTGGAS